MLGFHLELAKNIRLISIQTLHKAVFLFNCSVKRKANETICVAKIITIYSVTPIANRMICITEKIAYGKSSATCILWGHLTWCTPTLSKSFWFRIGIQMHVDNMGSKRERNLSSYCSTSQLQLYSLFTHESELKRSIRGNTYRILKFRLTGRSVPSIHQNENIRFW